MWCVYTLNRSWVDSCYERSESGESHLETNTTTLVRCETTVTNSAVHSPSSKLIKLLHFCVLPLAIVYLMVKPKALHFTVTPFNVVTLFTFGVFIFAL